MRSKLFDPMVKRAVLFQPVHVTAIAASCKLDKNEGFFDLAASDWREQPLLKVVTDGDGEEDWKGCLCTCTGYYGSARRGRPRSPPTLNPRMYLLVAVARSVAAALLQPTHSHSAYTDRLQSFRIQGRRHSLMFW